VAAAVFEHGGRPQSTAESEVETQVTEAVADVG
jgi:hypothetical protein